jgi:hypothetical protein
MTAGIAIGRINAHSAYVRARSIQSAQCRLHVNVDSRREARFSGLIPSTPALRAYVPFQTIDSFPAFSGVSHSIFDTVLIKQESSALL